MLWMKCFKTWWTFCFQTCLEGAVNEKNNKIMRIQINAHIQNEPNINDKKWIELNDFQKIEIHKYSSCF